MPFYIASLFIGFFLLLHCLLTQRVLDSKIKEAHNAGERFFWRAKALNNYQAAKGIFAICVVLTIINYVGS